VTNKPMKNTPATAGLVPPVNSKAYVLSTPIAMKMAKAYADTLLEHAYIAFKAKPQGGNTWMDLQRAMVVYQQTQESDAPAIAAIISDAPIGNWGALIVKAVTGKSISAIISDENDA
jgi:hypothetical protein